MSTEAENENLLDAQSLEDEVWALAAAEARKSGYIGPEETMRLLMRYAEVEEAEETDKTT